MAVLEEEGSSGERRGCRDTEGAEGVARKGCWETLYRSGGARRFARRGTLKRATLGRSAEMRLRVCQPTSGSFWAASAASTSAIISQSWGDKVFVCPL